MVARNYIFGKKYGTDLLTNLVGYYPLDANGNDFSGNGYNGTFDPTKVAFGAGKVGNAGLFIKDVSSRISIADNNDFSFTDAVNDLPFTLSLWTSVTARGNHFLLMKYLGATTASEWGFYLFGNKLRGLIVDKNTNGTFILKETTFLLSNLTFYHLVITYDGSKTANGMKIYINAVNQATVNLSSGTYTGMGNGTLPTTIGNSSQNTTPNNATSGKIDEVVIWKNRELTQAEVTRLYNKGNSGLPLIL